MTPAEIVLLVILICGLLVIVRALVNVLFWLFVGFRNYIWARIFTVNFVKRYGKWAVVTGSTDGIGKAYAFELARRGMNIVLISRSEEKLLRVANKLSGETGVEVKVITADFTRGDDVRPGIEENLKGLDVGVLVNNVGLGYEPCFFHERTIHDDRNLLEVNAQTMVTMTHIVLPGMVERKRGVVVNVSSAAGLYPCPLLTTYSSSKTFISRFTNTMSYEYSRFGVKFQNATPFYVRTNMTAFMAGTFRGVLAVVFPDADTYAKAAVATIPWAQDTMGHWSHGLKWRVLGFWGEASWRFWFARLSLRMRKKMMRKNGQVVA